LFGSLELVRQRTTLLSNGGGGVSGLGDPINMEKYVHDAQQLQRLQSGCTHFVTRVAGYARVCTT
jgi:hypothetical protein